MESATLPSHDHELGKRGELAAARHLEAAGLSILHRNWAVPGVGELDIVATNGTRLIFCEVKTRSGDAFGTPAEAISAEQIERIRQVATIWLATYRIPFQEIRFDAIGVLWRPGHKPVIEHFKAAF